MVEKKSDKIKTDKEFTIDIDMKQVKNKRFKDGDEEVFKFVPNTMICGQTKSGKTVLLQNLLHKIIIPKIGIENLFIICSSFYIDNMYSELAEKIFKKDRSLFETNIATGEK